MMSDLAVSTNGATRGATVAVAGARIECTVAGGGARIECTARYYVPLPVLDNHTKALSAASTIMVR